METAISSISEQLMQAVALHKQGKLDDAEIRYRALLQTEPHHADLLQYFALLHAHRGQNNLAFAYWNQVLELSPSHFACLMNYAKTLIDLQQYELSLEKIEQALLVQPDSSQAWLDRGNALFGLHQYAEAADNYRRALAIEPNFAEAYSNLGNSFTALGDAEGALAYYGCALKIKPDFADAHNNIGHALKALGRLDEALQHYSEALEIRPDYADAHHNMALVLKDIGRLDEALASSRRALEIAPDFAVARLTYAFMLLLVGDYTHGWQEYECRWQLRENRPQFEFFQPLWLGLESLHGKAIMLHAEQGFGDTLQFIRYAPLIAARGATVYAAVPAQLKSLVESCAGVHAVFVTGDCFPDVDYQSPLLSLPLACNTEYQSIPADIPYLGSRPSIVEHWAQILGPKNVWRVGLVWAGNPREYDVAAHAIDSERSMPFREFHSLLELDGIEFYSLQLGEAARKQSSSTALLKDLMLYVESFEDTAGLIENLDLVISVDTSVAHLAGAIGKPVWLLNRYYTCWRWFLNREDSPWYPTMRIFRQKLPGDWSGVMADVKQALKETFNSTYHAR